MSEGRSEPDEVTRDGGKVYLTRLAENAATILEVVKRLTRGKVSEHDQQLVLDAVEAQLAALDTVRDARAELDWQKRLNEFNEGRLPVRWFMRAIRRVPCRSQFQQIA